MKSQMTAYASNTRKQDRQVEPCSARNKLAELVARDYAFANLTYPESAVLFRGMSNGLVESILSDRFAAYEDDKPHAELESELGVYFLSHDLSDAITCARIWEAVDDAGIIVMATEIFKQRQQHDAAAMMQFAEPGVVFDYPFLCEPVALAEIELIYINDKTHRRLQESIDLPVELAAKLVLIEAEGRAAIETFIQASLHQQGYSKASPVTIKP